MSGVTYAAPAPTVEAVLPAVAFLRDVIDQPMEPLDEGPLKLALSGAGGDSAAGARHRLLFGLSSAAEKVKHLLIPIVLWAGIFDVFAWYGMKGLSGRFEWLAMVTGASNALASMAIVFFILKDLTSGKQTYAAGRFLYTGMPKDGKLILDFNKTENPPCAFTAFATCPLPPKQNHLPVAVTAGERKPANGAASH
jgi:hypothetical protein